MASLATQHAVLKQVARRHDFETLPEELELNSIPLATFWYCLGDWTVRFWNFRREHSGGWTIEYAFLPRSGKDCEYSDDAPSFNPTYPWMQGASFHYDSEMAKRIPTHDELEAKATLAIVQHASVRGYFRRLIVLYHLGAVTQHIASNGPILADKKVDEQTYLLTYNVILVSALEALLFDTFFASHSMWFSHELDLPTRNAHAKKFLTRLGLENWLYEAPGEDPVYVVRNRWKQLRETRRINFQNLKGKSRSAKWAFREALGVHLPDLLTKIDRDAWADLLNAARGRHLTIHPGVGPTMMRGHLTRMSMQLRSAQCQLVQSVLAKVAIDRTVRI